MKILLAIGILLLCSGCASMGVEPWERDILAKDEMQLTTDALEAATDDHIYFSKEASSGGRGFSARQFRCPHGGSEIRLEDTQTKRHECSG